MASNFPRPDGQTLLRMYRIVSLIRQNDERSHKVIRSGRLVMPYYSPKGQEIIPAALVQSLNTDDYLCTIYRGSHDMLAKGLPLKAHWAEIAGRATGPCKGKGGPMHVTHPETGIMVTTGIVGSSMPIANGLAWSSLLSKDGRVTVACFGDGAANIGAFHESLNLAALWMLPVIFICQNNGYAEHTSFANSTLVERLSTRAAGYGLPGVTVNGNDPDEMYGAAKIAVERARAGEGPTFIEALTYRHYGHLYGDDGKYMDQDERAAAIADDPFPKLRERILNEGIATADALDAMDKEIEAELDEAVEFALASPTPDLSEIKRDVFAYEIG